MIDTSTVTFDFEKLTETFQKVVPHVQNVSVEYVKFVTTETITELIMSVTCLIFFVVTLHFLNKIYLSNDNLTWVAAIHISIIFFCVILVLVCINSTILVLCHPEMFTISKIINSAGCL